ncbi:hypothetical protein HN51_058101 [Arachis hypogaea]|uniref:GOLD domain-containing protein n=1 Tax=Arachis hypogaea TaxID=3818 RepID=A0A444WZK0_ARAHY|nr:transmembrane emp24 domain-containing protein p24delta4-like [Arachis ipaensis]XP_025683422.1 transmembrane emp24 domain-containing protein p24delta4 [Arachis hypogaea]QHN81270.1 Transmembrane emp24 domain-containing protein [Arachis hypogaea]RYQ82820.1 hypothetical protein Ahy_B10g101386 [Arachis hypogaea]
MLLELQVKVKAIVLLLIFCFFLLSLSPPCGAIWITLQAKATSTKCVSEEIQSNIIVLANYFVVAAVGAADLHHRSPPRNPTISVKVTSPYGNNLHFKENATIGKFAFTTTETGSYLACFWVAENQGNEEVQVNLDWKIGIAATEWETVAKKEKIEGVELELRKLEEAVVTIHENLLNLKNRESNMRGVSERTNARVAWLSIMSLGICIVVSALQFWHLKRYFVKKKLI